ncbi:MAG: hypothetical protein JWP58_119 [Hymenobacter sp.]|nr:hypothetical protein [Hymenobacter sp.]
MKTHALPEALAPPVLIPDVLAVQHNALVNARFGLGTLEMRLFLCMLGRIGRNDTAFTECSIPVRELAPEGSANVPYSEVAAMVKQLTRRALDIEKLGPEGRRQKDPDIISIPLMSFASYSKSEGMVVSRFNDAIRPYLLQLRDNFTKAEIKHLQKLKSVSSHRIYWLLKEYAAFGRRTVSLSELRNLLGLTTEYEGRFDHFRARVLDRAQQELQETDMPFTYEMIRQGKSVTELRFLFAPGAGMLAEPAATSPAAGEEWATLLLSIGVAGKSLLQIKKQLEEGYYQEGYIHFVVERMAEQVRLGKIKKQAGAVYKALTEGYLLAEYDQALKSRLKAKALKPAAQSRQKKKLQGELDEAQNSLNWLRSPATVAAYAAKYPANPEIYPQHLAVAEKTVAALQAELSN